MVLVPREGAWTGCCAALEAYAVSKATDLLAAHDAAVFVLEHGGAALLLEIAMGTFSPGAIARGQALIDAAIVRASREMRVER